MYCLTSLSVSRLTVYEHVWFFARLKSQPEAGLPGQIDQMILDLGIPHKRYDDDSDVNDDNINDNYNEDDDDEQEWV